LLKIDRDEMIEPGMSGSPIISMAGRAIGVMSTGSDNTGGSVNPVIVETLPPRVGVARSQDAWPSAR
jgi:S1-C subfamily serine protease